MIAIGAWFGGLWRVARAPWIAALAYAALLTITVPLGVVLHRDLPPPSQPPVVEPGAGPAPNLDWLDETTTGRGGLAGSLAATVIGVAAPLDNLDRLLEGSRPPLFAIALSAISMMVWVWLWGGIISRYSGGSRPFFTSCSRFFAPILKVSAAGVLAAIALYVTVQPLLFDVAWPAVTAGTSERAAFFWRVALAVPFIAMLTLTTLVADYARISLVLKDERSMTGAIADAISIIRANPTAVLMVAMAAALLLAGLLVTYGAFEFIPGGSVPTLGRVILIGQGFIVTRIVLRLVNAAAQVVLFERIRLRGATR
jgi:hypothetical protein